MTATTTYQIEKQAAAPYTAQGPKLLRGEQLWAYVLAGEFRFTLNGAGYTMPTGSSLLVPDGAVYTWQNILAAPGKMLLVRAAASGKVAPVFLRPGESRMGRRLNIMGDPLNILLSSADTGDAFCVMEVWTSPNQGPPLHVHRREDEYFGVLEGRMEFSLDGRREMVEAGRGLLGKRDGTHTFRNAGEATSRMVVVALPGGMDAFFVALEGAQPEEMLPVFEQFGLEFAGPPLSIA